MTRYNLPDQGSQEWYSSPLYPAVADLDRRIGDTKDTSTSLAAQVAALQAAVTAAQADADAAQAAAAAAQASADAANATKPYWYGYLASNVTLSDNTNTLITTWTQDTTSGGFFYSAGILTLPALAGRYRVNATLFFDPSSNTGGRLSQVYSGSTGGNPIISGGTAGSTGANNKGQSAIAHKSIPFAAGAQIRVIGYQSAGGTLQVQGASTKNLSYFQVEYLGPE
jgi:hypothetical protein